MKLMHFLPSLPESSWSSSLSSSSSLCPVMLIQLSLAYLHRSVHGTLFCWHVQMSTSPQRLFFTVTSTIYASSICQFHYTVRCRRKAHPIHGQLPIFNRSFMILRMWFIWVCLKTPFVNTCKVTKIVRKRLP